LEQRVRDTRPDADDRTIKATALAYASLAYGFALMRAGNRISPFMRGGLSDKELVEALLSFDLAMAARLDTMAKAAKPAAGSRPASSSRRK
jgi:hypothetical protein